MRIKAFFIFVATLALYGATLYGSSYVGVYLSYLAIPVILISGYILFFYTGASKALLINTHNTTKGVVSRATNMLEDLNSRLDRMNRILALKQQRTINERKMMRSLESQKDITNVHLRHAKSTTERIDLSTSLKAIDVSIREVEAAIGRIEKQCELEVLQS